MLYGLPYDGGVDDFGITYVNAQHDDVEDLGIAHLKGELGDGSLYDLDVGAGDLVSYDGRRV